MEKNCKTPTFEQFQALCSLKKAGVMELVVEFEGCNDSGFFSNMTVLPKDWRLHTEYQSELQLALQYLESNLELYEGYISFSDDGCKGALRLNFQKSVPELRLMVYVPCRAWRVARNFTSEVRPSTEVERVLSEA